MAGSKPTAPGTKSSHNGHTQNPAPAAAPSLNKTQSAEVSTPHITSRDEGPAAPGDTTVRPVHPTMGGPLYASSVPSRDSRYPLTLTEDAFVRYSEDHLLRITGLRQLQDTARHGTQITRETLESLTQNARERLQKAEGSREAFIARSTKVHGAITTTTTLLQARLQTLDAEIAAKQLEAMKAHCLPGVPRADIRTRDAATVSSAAPVGQQTCPAQPGSTSPTVSKEAAPVNPEAFTPRWIKISKIGLGTAVGLAVGTNQRYLTLPELHHAEMSASFLWLPFWIFIGAFAISTLTDGLYRAWKYAGERSAGEPASNAILHWRSMRHTCLPLLVTVLICAMEAAVLRNAQVASSQVKDPGNWLYFVGNFALILPATLQASVSGWTSGCALRAPEIRAEREAQTQAAAHAARDEVIIASAEAQTAFALDDYVTTLLQRRDELLEQIADLEFPLRTLRTHYLTEMEAPVGLTEAENQIVSAAREDAKAAHLIYKQKFDQFEDVVEPLPDLPILKSFTLCLVRSTDGDLIANPSAPVKLSVWQRIRAFFGRMRERRAKRKEEAEEAAG